MIFALLLSLLQDPSRFDQGNILFEGGKYAEALTAFEEVLKTEPDHREALHNAGMAALMAGKPDRAAEHWETLRKKKPDDLKLLAKLVQAYQKSNAAEKRDAVRKDLVEQRDKYSDAEKARQPAWCRDQFKVGDVPVMVFEYFDLKGDMALRYRFSILDADGAEKEYVSLGSYEMTTRVARELEQIGKEDRLFHLDGYFGKAKTHAAFEVFKKEPTYDEVRDKVIKLLEMRSPVEPKK